MKAITPLAVGALFAFAAALSAAAAASMIAPDGPLDGVWATNMHAREDMLLLRPASTAGFVLIALATAAAAYGCFVRRRWGRALAVVLLAINALFNTIRAIQGEALHGAIGLAIAAAIILWITRPRVKALFS